MEIFKATTIVGIRKNGKTAIAGDGQVTTGSTIAKGTVVKVRELFDGRILSGFAGSVTDAFTLYDMFESKLKTYKGDLTKASVELAKDWRKDKFLRRLEALLLVMDKDNSYIISGAGDIIKYEEGVCAIGSGGEYARAAGRALVENTELDAAEIAKKSLEIAGDVCIYTNKHITVLEIK